MDDRYYSRRVELGSSGHHLTMIFIDSSPCITEYRSESKEGWDPCGTEYPTCSLSGGGDEFEGPCQFHDNIIAQDCGAQLAWFKKTLAAAPKDDWLFVVGHHPADELDVEDFTTAMQQHGFDLYLNGHVHTLTQYQLDGGGAYVTSGAGALVMSHDQLGGTPAKDRTYRKANSVELELLADASAAPSGHSYKQVFNAKVSGFTLHTFSDDYTQLSTVFLDTHGKTLHSFTVNKGGSPAPAPPPPPGPSGGCCFYHTASCSRGQTCCSESGKSYHSEYTCERYGKAHGCHWTNSNCVVGGAAVAV